MDRPGTRWFGVIGALARACHPEPALTVTVALAALAVATGRSWIGVLSVFVAVLASQLAIGWSNDWLDASRDARAGRRDKPIVAGRVRASTVRTAAIAATVACVPLSLLSGPLAAAVHLISTACGWAYNAGLKSSVLSPVPYAFAFGSAPAFVVLGLPDRPAPPLWLLATGALLGVGAHFANVIPDLADDAATGVQGLPHRLGAAGSGVAAAVLLAAASAVLAFGPPGPVRPAGAATFAVAVVVLGVGLVLGRRPGSRAPFRAVLVVAIVDIVLLLATGTRLA